MRCKVIASRTRERMFGCHFSMCLSSIFVSRARFQQNCVNVCNVFRADSVIGVAYGIESIEWMNAWMNVKFKTKWEKHNLKKEFEPKYQQVSERTPYSEWMEHKSAMIETLKWSLKWLPIVFASGCLYDMDAVLCECLPFVHRTFWLWLLPFQSTFMQTLSRKSIVTVMGDMLSFLVLKKFAKNDWLPNARHFPSLLW